MSDLTAEELEQGRRSLLSQLRRDLKRDLSEYPVDAATMRDLVEVLEGLAPKPADNGSAVPWSGEHTDTHSFVGGVLAMSTPNAPWRESDAEPVGVTRNHCTCEVGMGTYPGDHHEKGCRLNPIECDHSESLYGRCTACGMTWEQQAEQRSQPVGVSDERAVRDVFVKFWNACLCNSDVPGWSVQQEFETARDAIMALARPLPTREQIAEWLSDHDIVWREHPKDSLAARVQQCQCGWMPDSWQTDDEFEEYHREHRSAAVLALMGGAETPAGE